MASLVMQRIALERERAIGRACVALGALFVVPALVTIGSAPLKVLRLTVVIAPVLLFMYGFEKLRTYRRDVAAFEAEHGPDAGIQ